MWREGGVHSYNGAYALMGWIRRKLGPWKSYPLWSLWFLTQSSFHVLSWILAPLYLSSEVPVVGRRVVKTIAPGLRVLLTRLAWSSRIVFSCPISFQVNSVAFFVFLWVHLIQSESSECSLSDWLALTWNQEASEQSYATDFHPLCGKDSFLIVFFKQFLAYIPS